MKNFKTLAATALIAATALVATPKAEATPQFNQPRNGGATTLAWKCQELNTAEKRWDFGRMTNLALQMGFEHETENLTTQEACAAVGVQTNF